MNPKLWINCALLLGVAAAPARAQQQPRPQTAAPNFNLQAVTTESESAFAQRIYGLRFSGQWAKLIAIGRARREAHPDETVGWHAEALGAYGNGDVEAAIAAWEAAPKLREIPDGPTLLANARAVQRNYPGQKFPPLQFVRSDVTNERFKWQGQASILLKARDYDAIEAKARELQKSGQADALGLPYLQTFFDGLAKIYQEHDIPAIQQSVNAWRAARPDSVLARLVEIKLATDMAWRARGEGFADSLTPAMSEKMSEALERGAQGIGALPASAVESPLMFVVMQRWGQLAGDGRPFLDAIYREGSARFPAYQPLLRVRILNLLPRWYGAPGELMQLLREHADKIGGIEGDMDYAMGFINARYYEGDLPHDNARFWRGFDALRKRSPDSIALRTTQVQFGVDQGLFDGNYRYAESALSEPNGYILDQMEFDESQTQANVSERRMEILAGAKPR